LKKSMEVASYLNKEKKPSSWKPSQVWWGKTMVKTKNDTIILKNKETKIICCRYPTSLKHSKYLHKKSKINIRKRNNKWKITTMYATKLRIYVNSLKMYWRGVIYNPSSISSRHLKATSINIKKLNWLLATTNISAHPQKLRMQT
jgi:hypothetical protein